MNSLSPDLVCRDPVRTPLAAGAAAALSPVESPAAVWAAARREFRAGRIDRVPQRARMLDVLDHLQRGHLLALMGSTLPAVWLDGYPDIALLAGVLFCCGWVEIVGCHRDHANIVYFRLSPAGTRKLAEGRAWWRSLSLVQRLAVRLFG